LARLESPDLCAMAGATFSPDGSRLVVTTPEGPAVHIWDLRAIRKRLAAMGLDWGAPAYPPGDPSDRSAPLLPPVQVYYQGNAIAQGDALAQEGRWDEAAAAYDRAFDDGVLDQPHVCYDHAILRLAVGDTEGYHRIGAHMLNVFTVFDKGERHDQGYSAHALRWLEFTADVLALAPGGRGGPAKALELAERRAAILRTQWSDHLLGMDLYRAGRLAEANALLRGILDRNPDPDYRIQEWLVLSMVQQRLNRPGDARRWLEQAEAWVAVRLRGRPGGFDRAIPENWHWRDGIILHLLLREARNLIGAEPPTLPEDPFAPAP
jgi:tetratricopeptide (TPR) repeat protein